MPSGGARIELHAADSTCNPYLGMALMIAAVLEGVNNQTEPADPNKVTLFEQSDAYRAECGVEWLPRSLPQAITSLESDPLSKQVLVESMLQSRVTFKRDEWTAFNHHGG